MSNVGFIGLGTMGRHMAKNLIQAGHRLTFFARRREVIAEFAELGGTFAPTPAEVARAADAICSIVTADAEVREIALGSSGVLAGCSPGKLYLEMSTIGPGTVREVGAEFAKAGIGMLDAPVSGGPWGAEAGTLTIMCGGTKQDFDRASPLLMAMGKKLFHLGPLGSGATVKVINQMMGGAIMALAGESMVLARAAGVDLEAFIDVVLASSGNSAVFEARSKKFVLAGNYSPGFKTELMRKDVDLGLELGRRLNVPLPVAAAAFQQYVTAVRQGLGEEDFAAVAKVYAQAAGIELVENK